MNLILFTDNDLDSRGHLVLRDRRARHINEILRSRPGDTLRVGRIDGEMGAARILEQVSDRVSCTIELGESPPAPLPLVLYIALPRPKVVGRVLRTATALGIKKIYLFNALRVEKVYWSCEQIRPEAIYENCLLGLEQARDTKVPEVHLRRLFKPFVEDELGALIENSRALLAHPSAQQICPRGVEGHISLFIGPEGGFIPYEIDKLREVGCQPVHFHQRILRVETALAALVGRLV